MFVDFINDSNALGELKLQTIFGLKDTTTDPLAPIATPLLQTRRLEYLNDLWRQQDWPTDAYSEGLLPIIDPDVIGPDDFREPDPNEKPFKLWQVRRKTLDNRRRQLVEFYEEQGLSRTIGEVMGVAFQHLDALYADLSAGNDIEKTRKRIEDFSFTVESFAALMALKDKAENGIALTAEEVSDGINILLQVEKVRKYLDWINMEKNQGIEFGPRHFYHSLREPVEGEWSPQHDKPWIDPESVERKDLPEPTAGQQAILLWQHR